jgi:hypothetical protein
MSDPFDPILRDLARSPSISPRARTGANVRRVGSSSRFRFVSALGRGGMGSVDRVFDERRKEDVAVKRATGASSSERDTIRREWSRFKREFRVIAALRHPSLVRVFELGEDDRGLFFTMEIVAGTTLGHFCRHSGGFDQARLAAVLPSLLEGLAHLHVRGLVHRDLKPSNVLVDESGRARIVDFGILAELWADAGEIIGTPAYMAPEQVRGERPSPAMDRYALGAMLHELVDGAPPFDGTSPSELFAHHLETAPPRVSTPCDDTLAASILMLLSKDPAARPTLEDLAGTLVRAIGAEQVRFERAPANLGGLEGREGEQDRIALALEGEAFAVIVLEGATGIGKTALAEWAAARCADRGVRVLLGRARRNELVAFNAIDGIVDELAAVVRTLPPEDVGIHQRRASLAFPVLGPRDEAIDSAGARAAAFDGLTRLLAVVASYGGLVLVIDDLQWADEDSIAFLRALEAAAPARFKLLATLRNDVQPSSGSRWAEEALAQRVAVDALRAASLARIVSRASERTVSDAEAAALAERCAGRPFFAELAGRLARATDDPPPDLDTMLSARVAELDAPGRRTLAMLAAADEWLDAPLVAEACGITPGMLDDLSSELESAAIVRRSSGANAEALDMYHDVSREVVRRVLGEDALRTGHRALASALDRRPSADPLRIVRHLAAAGDIVHAAERAAVEAQRAERRGAYGLSAELYDLAAKGQPDRAPEWRRARATALIRAGLYDVAVAELESIAPTDRTERESLEFDRGYTLFMAGDIVAGRRSLDTMLRQAGVRRMASEGLALVPDGLRFFAGPKRVPEPRGTLDVAAGRERRERETEIALLLSWEEPGAAVSWAHRVRTLADRAGRPEGGAAADYVLGFLAAASGGKRVEAPLAQRFLESARTRARPIAGEAHVRALDRAVPALVGLRTGAGMRSGAEFIAIAAELEQAGLARTHTHLLALSNACGAAMVAERPNEIAQALSRFESACPNDRGAMEAHAVVVRIVLAIYEGDQARYRDAREQTAASIAATGLRFHHVLNRFYAGYGEIFWGDPVRLRAEYAELVRAGRRFKLFDTYLSGSVWSLLAIAEARALIAGDRQASMGRIERWAKLVRDAPLGSTGAIRAEAYAADHRGERARALRLLEEAETRADRVDAPISRAIARYQRGVRSNDDRLVRAARADLKAIGGGKHLLAEDPSVGPRP